MDRACQNGMDDEAMLDSLPRDLRFEIRKYFTWTLSARQLQWRDRTPV
ncbi:hypothetical protein BVRB_3g058830 [Beta vulgaris subsp. vulgaris]|nr:hypothetical protein BVRB_3g058830 [Beta vulgaris subsp. vulgaris]